MTSTILPLSEPYGPVSFREAGRHHEAGGPPVVLIHGVGLNAAIWEPQLKALSQSYHVIALDLPGHGGSAPLRDGTPLPGFVSWLQAVLDAMALDRAHLVGHSMGALIAGGAAVEYPDRVSSLALLNAVFRRTDAAMQAVQARARSIAEGGLDLETPLSRWFPDAPADNPARAKTAELLSAVDIGGYATAYRAFAEGDATYADHFPRIRCPVLAITGGRDLNSTPTMSRAIGDTVQDGRAIVVDGHGHMMPLTASDAVNAELILLFGRSRVMAETAGSDR